MNQPIRTNQLGAVYFKVIMMIRWTQPAIANSLWQPIYVDEGWHVEEGWIQLI